MFRPKLNGGVDLHQYFEPGACMQNWNKYRRSKASANSGPVVKVAESQPNPTTPPPKHSTPRERWRANPVSESQNSSNFMPARPRNPIGHESPQDTPVGVHAIANPAYSPTSHGSECGRPSFTDIIGLSKISAISAARGPSSQVAGYREQFESVGSLGVDLPSPP